jgi:hypothetical protein
VLGSEKPDWVSCFPEFGSEPYDIFATTASFLLIPQFISPGRRDCTRKSERPPQNRWSLAALGSRRSFFVPRFQREANPGMFIPSERGPARVCKTEHQE